MLSFNEVSKQLSSASPIVLIDVSSMSSLGLEITGTWTGTISFEYTIDGQTFHGLKDQLNGSQVKNTTANGSFQFNVAGFKAVRVNFSTPTSGSPIATLHSSEASISSGSASLTPTNSTNGGPISASTLVQTGATTFYGYIVTASSSGVVRVWDSTTNSGTKVLDSMAVSAGNIITVPNGPTQLNVGLYIEIVSGTCTLTPLYH